MFVLVLSLLQQTINNTNSLCVSSSSLTSSLLSTCASTSTSVLSSGPCINGASGNQLHMLPEAPHVTSLQPTTSVGGSASHVGGGQVIIIPGYQYSQSSSQLFHPNLINTLSANLSNCESLTHEVNSLNSNYQTEPCETPLSYFNPSNSLHSSCSSSSSCSSHDIEVSLFFLYYYWLLIYFILLIYYFLFVNYILLIFLFLILFTSLRFIISHLTIQLISVTMKKILLIVMDSIYPPVLL